MTERADRSQRDTAHPRETWLVDRTGVPARLPGRLTVAVAYPSTYRLGMSNLGFQTALRLFDEEPDVVCERAFLSDDSRGDAPPPGLAVTTPAHVGHAADSECCSHASRAPGAPGPGETGASCETGSPLSAFDVVAFSVSFEDDYRNVVSMLSAAGIPLESEARTDNDPLVVAGGMCAYLNPEPIAPCLDAVLVGEAGALVAPFLAAVRESRGLDRPSRLRRIARVGGAYVPSFYEVQRGEGGEIAGFTADEGAPLPVRAAGGPTRMAESVVLSDEAFFEDMFLVEMSRGCARGCRFCAAGTVLEPRYHHPAREVLEVLGRARRHTDRVGLVTAALLDHPEALEILRAARDSGVELNVSSLRADAVTPEAAVLLAGAGVRTVTLAPETADEELRRIIGKPVTDDRLVGAARTLADAGIAGLKLYFMIGLPGETEADIDAIPKLARRIRSEFVRGRTSARVSVSVSPFVPKPRTSFQWLPMASERRVREVVGRLRRAFAESPRLEFTSAGPREAAREGVLARGGRELFEPLRLAAVEGVPWKAALRRCGVDVGSIVRRERSESEVFPWEAVEAGPARTELLRGLKAAKRLMERRSGPRAARKTRED